MDWKCVVIIMIIFVSIIIIITIIINIINTVNAGLQAVAVQGAHRGYELKQADVTCSVMTELSVINMRRLFANRGVERMNLAKEGSGSTPRLRKTTNAVMDM
jgi:hypothetical protein